MKRLACFLDGTWNNTEKTTVVTNVAKLCESVADHDKPGVVQLRRYVTGIDAAEGIRSKFLKGAIGLGVGHRTKEGYLWFTEVYEPGDEIYLFGFSRGAFEARSLAAFISLFGIARKVPETHAEKIWLDQAWDVYRQAPEKRDVAELERLRGLAHYPIRIKCLGVWDTVGNIGNSFISGTLVGRRLSFHDTRLLPTIDVVLHALSIDEVRGPFRPTLFTLPEGQELAPNQIVEQVWFSGVHADVGGGFEESRLSDVSLEWMMDRVSATTGLAFDRTRLDQWTRERVSAATGVAIREIPKTPSIRPNALGVQHSSWADALFALTNLFPFIRLIKQDAGAIPGWRARLIGTWRSGKLPAGVVSINEQIHESVARRFGRPVIEMRGNRSHIITYAPASLSTLAPDVWSPLPAQLPVVPGPDDAPKRVKIFTVHGTFAHEADWDNWDKDDVFTSRVFPNEETTPPAGNKPINRDIDRDDEIVAPLEQRHFVNRLSERLWKNGVIFSPADHTEYNWSGGNSHDERRTAAVGLKKAMEKELAGKSDYYSGGIYVIGHSHGGTISRLAMNLWDKDFDCYKPIRNEEELKKHDGFKLDDDCPHCMRERNGRVGPNTVPRPTAVVTLGSPFVTFAPRRGGLLAAQIGVWVFRAFALIPLIALLIFFSVQGGPLNILAELGFFNDPWAQTVLLIASPLAVYWLIASYVPKRVLHRIAKGYGRRTTRYAFASMLSKFITLAGLVALISYYLAYMNYFGTVAGPLGGKSAFEFIKGTALGHRELQRALCWIIPFVLYWLFAINLPSRLLTFVRSKVLDLKEGLPKKYDPREDSPVTYAAYTTMGDEPGIGLRIFGLNTWLIQTLSLSAACVLAFGVLLLVFVGIEVLESFGPNGSLMSRLGYSAWDPNEAHHVNLIDLFNRLTAYPRAVWGALTSLIGQSGGAASLYLDKTADLNAVKNIPAALTMAVAVTFFGTSVLVVPVLGVMYLLNNTMRSSGVAFGSEHYTWTLANRIAVARRANANTMIRRVHISLEAWRKGQIAHCYYYNSEDTTNDIADYIAGKVEHKPDSSWGIGRLISAIGRLMVVVLFVMSIFAITVMIAKSWDNTGKHPVKQSGAQIQSMPKPAEPTVSVPPSVPPPAQ